MTNFIDQLSELQAAATPGPWVHDPERGEIGTAVGLGDVVWFMDNEGGGLTGPTENGELIVFLRNNADSLLALVKAAKHARQYISTYPERSPASVAAIALDIAIQDLDK